MLLWRKHKPTPMTNKLQNLRRPSRPFYLGDHLLVQFLGDILPPSVTFPIHNHCPMAPCSGTNEPDWQLVVLLISAVVTVCYFPLAFFTSHTLGCHAPPPCVTLIKCFLPFHILYILRSAIFKLSRCIYLCALFASHFCFACSCAVMPFPSFLTFSGCMPFVPFGICCMLQRHL